MEMQYYCLYAYLKVKSKVQHELICPQQTGKKNKLQNNLVNKSTLLDFQRN